MQPTGVPPADFLARVPNPTRRADADRLVQLFREVTGHEPVMWGPSIIGFGSYHYQYASGRNGDAPAAGFSPRKAHLVVYLVADFQQRYAAQLATLGPYTAGTSCLYLKRLDGIDEDTLRWLIADSYAVITARYPQQD